MFTLLVVAMNNTDPHNRKIKWYSLLSGPSAVERDATTSGGALVSGSHAEAAGRWLLAQPGHSSEASHASSSGVFCLPQRAFR